MELHRSFIICMCLLDFMTLSNSKSTDGRLVKIVSDTSIEALPFLEVATSNLAVCVLLCMENLPKCRTMQYSQFETEKVCSLVSMESIENNPSIADDIKEVIRDGGLIAFSQMKPKPTGSSDTTEMPSTTKISTPITDPPIPITSTMDTTISTPDDADTTPGDAITTSSIQTSKSKPFPTTTSKKMITTTNSQTTTVVPFVPPTTPEIATTQSVTLRAYNKKDHIDCEFQPEVDIPVDGSEVAMPAKCCQKLDSNTGELKCLPTPWPCCKAEHCIGPCDCTPAKTCYCHHTDGSDSSKSSEYSDTTIHCDKK